MAWYCSLLWWWLHHRFIVVAQVGEYTLVAAWMLKYAHALSMTQQGFVKIVDGASILREESLQQGMGGVGCDFFADEAQAS